MARQTRCGWLKLVGWAWAAIGPAVAARADCEPGWSSGFAANDFGAPVYVMAVFDDGTGPALYVGGVTSGVVKWNGQAWSSVGGTLGGSEIPWVCALTVFDDDGDDQPALFVGGGFATAGGVVVNCIAKWDGVTWSALGSGMAAAPGFAPWVSGLEVFDDDGDGPNPPALYAVGQFQTAGGIAAPYIAKWDGVAWSDVGGGLNDFAGTLAVFDEDGPGPRLPALYAGGLFNMAGGVPTNCIAKWNGLDWSSVGGGTNNRVHTMTVYGGELIVGGSFTTAGGLNADHIAKWDGATWAPLGAGTNDWVGALASYNDQLIVGGFFTTAGGSNANHIASWDGAAWSPLGTGTSDIVDALAVFDDDGSGPLPAALYVGGQFTSAGNLIMKYFAKWDGADWLVLGDGVGGDVYALARYEGGLIAGGEFASVAGLPYEGVARWDGTEWAALGGGVSGYVGALTVYDGALIAGGWFAEAGNVDCNNIASWDGMNWAPLGTGMNSGVYALGVYNGDLIAGGAFTTAGGVNCDYVARWDGTQWHALGEGVGGDAYPIVEALTVYDGELVAGGLFTYAGEVVANNIARWDGTQWHELGSGMTGWPFAFVCGLTVYGGELIAGGWFTRAGDVVCHHIAAWDGAAWHRLGTGMDSGVRVLGRYNGELIAGGDFTGRIARWDGAQWQSLGSGVDGTVYGLQVYAGALFAGGYFHIAGGLSSAHVARWAFPEVLPGDLDCDDDVDADDYTIFVGAFGHCEGATGFNVMTDYDQDGCTTLVDYRLWRGYYQNFSPDSILLTGRSALRGGGSP
jgi:hypothetical protein